MRNIALLEWGPASLYYILPRERIKVRTAWLEGGPVLPPFLSNTEEGKTHVPDLRVRYALSAFEDLNSAIKNLRRCFGFPYSEYIGYLNTMAKSHRARREHESLIERLRRWAIYGNVDAVLWIDYSKSNQPPGSFKMGPRDSRPFSAVHMEICAHGVTSGAGRDDYDGEESEAAWTDAEEEQGAALADRVGILGALGMELTATGASRGAQTTGSRGDTAVSWRRCTIGYRSLGLRRALPAPAAAKPAPASPSLGAPRPSEESPGSTAAREEADGGPAGRDSQLLGEQLVLQDDSERTVLRSMIQEEVIPAYGSIYKRTITPGPGYYYAGQGAAESSRPEARVTFGHRPLGRIDEVSAASRRLPGPGEYRPKAAFSEVKAQLGRFCRAERLVSPVEVARKLPFISSTASRSESFGVHSPPTFQAVMPEAPSHTRGYAQMPKYSFGRSRRPF